MSETTSGSTPEPVGVLVVRAWLEGTTEPRLRARITRSLDVASPLSEVSTSGDVDEVCEVVRRWLQEFSSRRTDRA